MKFKKIDEALIDYNKYPWDGLKGNEKLAAIKKYCDDNPSYDPRRVLYNSALSWDVEEEPFEIGEFKFVQDGKAWDVYKSDELYFTGNRSAVADFIASLWERGIR